MKTSLKSTNFWTQVVTLILSAFVLGGLNVKPDELGPDIVNAIVEDNYFSLLTIFVINLLNPIWQWIKTLKNNPTQFWGFLHSVNWWVSVFNAIVAGLLLWGGIEIPADAGEQIVAAIFEGRWMDLVTLVAINILIPIIKILFKKHPIQLVTK